MIDDFERLEDNFKKCGSAFFESGGGFKKSASAFIYTFLPLFKKAQALF